ncbi:MAG: hypothetical protein WBP41_22265 [Saprospiraceae bacterium]
MKIGIVLFLLMLLKINCNRSSIDFANQWSTTIKQNIIEDVNVQNDNTSIDSTNNMFWNFTLYHNGIRTKLFRINPTTNDTLLSIFYSPDQKFELVRELCPGQESSFEGIRYKNKQVGLAEFRYCNGKLKEQGYRFGEDVGIWREWDKNGKQIKETDYGNSASLKQLKNINYRN